jgi:hypothetical protein
LASAAGGGLLKQRPIVPKISGKLICFLYFSSSSDPKEQLKPYNYMRNFAKIHPY